MKPLLIMVGADKGGVGKTTTTRILADYIAQNKLDFRAYDTESPKGVLKRFHPAKTEVVDLTKVDQQMKVFDTLSTNPVTIVDIRAGLLSPSLKTLGNIGLMDLVQTNQVSLMALHVLGPSMASLDEIEETASAIPGAMHFLIKNHINDTEFFKWDKATYDKVFSSARSGIITIPQLQERAMEEVENAGVPFSNFVLSQTPDGNPANPPYSFVLRGLVKTWMKAVFEEFDRVNINGIIGSATF